MNDEMKDMLKSKFPKGQKVALLHKNCQLRGNFPWYAPNLFSTLNFKMIHET